MFETKIYCTFPMKAATTKLDGSPPIVMALKSYGHWITAPSKVNNINLLRFFHPVTPLSGLDAYLTCAELLNIGNSRNDPS